MMSARLHRWYIPLKHGNALRLLRTPRGDCLIRYRQLRTSTASHPCLHSNIDGDGSASASPAANDAVSGGRNRQRAKLEKQRRRRDKMDAIRRMEENEGAETDGGELGRADSRRKSWTEKEVISYDASTQPGEKKDVTCPLPASYSPTYVEACWYDWWDKMGFFKPESQFGERDKEMDSKPFVMCLPPPNVTGVLHLGHTLTATIQDSLVRWQRMVGVPTLWIPGCDHAGIATQVVVEKHLQHEKGVTRQQVGREEFVDHVWQWKEEKGDEIYRQLRRLGASLDWERESFTMDEKFSYAVREAFIRLHDDGTIYRSSQLVNWSCALKSAISDIEVDQVSLPGRTSLNVPGYESTVEFGTLTYFAYPVEGSGEEIPVATTRLETMLGDTAVAVHPDDPRYGHLIGQCVVHPFTGRRLPVIADESVEREFGTGAVKITPAHDYNDYEMGRRHSLESLTVIDESGEMTATSQQFQGMKRFDARTAVLQALKEKGLYREMKENPMSIPICSRSGDVVEPLLKSQWFVRCGDMGTKALRSVETGELEVVPQMYEKTWRNWLTNVRDWCVSRQLWWGHRIPAYRVAIKGQDPTMAQVPAQDGVWVSGHSEDQAREKAAKKLGMDPTHLVLTQDEDVLDTWFSSALFPFAVHGWPTQTPDLERFYPSSVLETGHDILFFWVARMVMMGQQLTGQLPFHKVYLHSMVRDSHGRKMSKSLGNVIDPLDVITGISLQALQSRLLDGNLKLDPKELEVAMKGQKSDYPQGIPECGTDALRFALASYNSQGQDINLNVNQVLEYRHFCNKIWNATKFALAAFETDFSILPVEEVRQSGGTMDRWIMSRLSATIQECQRGFETIDLPAVTSALYRFWLHNFCDVYLECVKRPLSDPQSHQRAVACNVLHLVVEGALRLMHPMMPFITEELYQRLPKHVDDDCPSICVSPYPSCNKYPFQDAAVELEVEVMLEVVRAVRSLQGMLGLKQSQAKVGIICQDEGVGETLRTLQDPLATLAKSSNVTISTTGSPPPGSAALAVGIHCTVFLELEGTSSAEASKRLRGRCSRAEAQLTKLKSTVSIPNYEEKVPANIREANQSKMEKLMAEITSLTKLLASLESSSTSS